MRVSDWEDDLSNRGVSGVFRCVRRAEVMGNWLWETRAVD